MELDLLNWKEKLELMEIGEIKEVDNDQSVYSAIRDNPDLFKEKQFSIRTDRTTKTDTFKGKQFVIRIK